MSSGPKVTLLFAVNQSQDQSFHSGTIPDIWKTATITPVFKKGCSCVVSNYRPISLTCICCRIMESIMKQKMLDYLLQYDLISRQQHGFCLGTPHVHNYLNV